MGNSKRKRSNVRVLQERVNEEQKQKMESNMPKLQGNDFDKLEEVESGEYTPKDEMYDKFILQSLNNSFESIKFLTEKIFTIGITSLTAWVYFSGKLISNEVFRGTISTLILLSVLSAFQGLYPMKFSLNYYDLDQREETINEILEDKKRLLFISSVSFLASLVVLYIGFGGNQ